MVFIIEKKLYLLKYALKNTSALIAGGGNSGPPPHTTAGALADNFYATRYGSKPRASSDRTVSTTRSGRNTDSAPRGIPRTRARVVSKAKTVSELRSSF